MLLGTLYLPGATPTPDEALSRAEALLASAICPALPSLSERTWQVEYRARNVQRGLGVPLYGRRHLGPSVLRYWPITSLVSVTQDGVDVTAQCVADTFSIRRDALSPEFEPLGLLTAVFKTGWTEQNVPPAIQEALLLTARAHLDNPLGLRRERLGDADTEYGTPGAGGLPAAAHSLIAPWRFVGA